jgi:cbb3-type cytochrome oxidase subunit 3
METNTTNDINIIEIAKGQGKLEAIKVCKLTYGMNRKEAKKHVDEITNYLNLPNQIISKKWIILILFFIVFIGLEIWMYIAAKKCTTSAAKKCTT